MSKSHASHGIRMTNTAAAAAARIEEDYAASRRYQHNIEIVRNPMQQPGTRTVVADIWQMPTGALKRVTWNDGPAMTEVEMTDYMTTIGAGGGEIWRLDNTLGHRHAGGRSSTLPFTDLLVLSWDVVEAPDGLTMRLFKDPVTHEYRHTDVGTPPPALLALLTDQDEVKAAGHGMAFAYLGRDEHVDGPFHDPNPLKGETDYGVIDALRDRFYTTLGTTGDRIELIVNAPMPVSKNKTAGGRKLVGVDGITYRLDGRRISGHAAWLAPECKTGAVVVDDDLDVKVRWALKPYGSEPSRHEPFGGKGHVLSVYKGESMIIAAPGDAYGDLPGNMRKWGAPLADVYNCLSLVIEGPTDQGDDPANPRLHLHQDPSRSKLVFSNGDALPLDEWGAKFIERMPEAIVNANREARERLGGHATLKFSTADRLKARIGSRLKAVIQSRNKQAGTGVLGPAGFAGHDYLSGMVTTTDLLPTGSPSTEGEEGVTSRGSGESGKTKYKTKKRGATKRARVQPTGTSTTRRRVPGDEAATEVKPRPAPIPEPVPTPRAKWIEQGLDPEDLASWDPPGGCVYFNLGHSIFHDQVSFFTGEWLERNPKIRLRVPADEVRNAVHEAYFEDTIARIMHVVAEHTMSLAKEHLTDRNLTIAAHGYENVQAKIESLIRTMAGRGVVTSGAAA